ncbi:hypothetical protein [Dyella sp.]|uniref:hypothetical protein n=1 Tax=Dyella sp. TaxID=1869338 RepID=UPI002FDB4E62
MHMIDRLKAELARAMRNFRYERTGSGIFFPAQRIAYGGIFFTSENGSAFVSNANTVAYEGLDDQLNCYFNNGSPPTLFSIAPFSNNVSPAASLTAATFASTQGEYTGYTQATRQQWISNGASSGQTVSSSNSPATFTIGASAATITGAGMIAGASAKGATTGKLIAAALFDSPQSLGANGQIQIYYQLQATPLG